MAKKSDTRAERALGVRATGKSGTCRVYGPDGDVLWEQDNFTVGVDRVPRRLSMSMVAMQVVDAVGDRVAVWNPWGFLAK